MRIDVRVDDNAKGPFALASRDRAVCHEAMFLSPWGRHRGQDCAANTRTGQRGEYRRFSSFGQAFRVAFLILTLGLLPIPLIAGEVHDAAKLGQFDKVVAIIEANPAAANEQDSNGETPLHCAVHGGFTGTVKFLLAMGADTTILNKSGMSALALARAYSRDEMVSLLINGSDTKHAPQPQMSAEVGATKPATEPTSGHCQRRSGNAVNLAV